MSDLWHGGWPEVNAIGGWVAGRNAIGGWNAIRIPKQHEFYCEECQVSGGVAGRNAIGGWNVIKIPRQQEFHSEECQVSGGVAGKNAIGGWHATKGSRRDNARMNYVGSLAGWREGLPLVSGTRLMFAGKRMPR